MPTYLVNTALSLPGSHLGYFSSPSPPREASVSSWARLIESVLASLLGASGPTNHGGCLHQVAIAGTLNLTKRSVNTQLQPEPASSQSMSCYQQSLLDIGHLSPYLRPLGFFGLETCISQNLHQQG